MVFQSMLLQLASGSFEEANRAAGPATLSRNLPLPDNA